MRILAVPTRLTAISNVREEEGLIVGIATPPAESHGSLGMRNAFSPPREKKVGVRLVARSKTRKYQ
jgi:hypothetical protein